MTRALGTGLTRRVALGLLASVAGLEVGEVAAKGRQRGSRKGAKRVQAAAATTTTQHLVVPVDATFFVPCVNDGQGEDIRLVGEVKGTIHTVQGPTGTSIRSVHETWWITATGLTSGNTYRMIRTGGSTSTSGPGDTVTSAATQLFIGPGGGDKFVAHRIFHYTINADGTVTAEHVHLTSECR